MKTRRRHKLLLAPALAAALLACADPAFAALSCSFDVDNLNFGDVDLTQGVPYTITGAVTSQCSGGMPLQWVTICPNIGSGTGNASAHDPRQLDKFGSSTEKLNYNLYHHGTSTIWGSFLWPYPERPPVIRIRLNFSGEGSNTTLIDARLFGGQNAHTKGTYISRFRNSHVAFQYLAGYHNDCNGATQTEKPKFKVRARNVKSCTVSATDLDFGTVGALSANVDSTADVTVRCTYQLPYKIKLLGPNDPTNRKMTLGSDKITYGTYRNAARSQPWGRFNSNDIDDTGTGFDQHFTIYGRVPPQPTPPPGTYTDTVTVRITF